MRTNAPQRRWTAVVVGVATVAALAGCASAPVSLARAAGATGPASIPVVFEWRTLAPMSAESLQPYACPAESPYLAREDHASFGDALIDGIEVERPEGSMTVAVTVTAAATDETGRAIGISTDPLTASAVNWSGESARYRIVLHCTE